MRNRAGEPLPGMPLCAGDPGVFVCGPDDIAPWERGPVRVPAPRRPSVLESVRAGAGDEQKRAPRLVWLVLATCRHCNPRTGRYCTDHDAGNWWLTRRNRNTPRGRS